MVDSLQLKRETDELADENVQKRFAALFDDQQGENARRAFVAYCRAHNLHPSDIYLLHGDHLFNRLWKMVKRQEKLLDEYRVQNKFLSEQVRQLNGGKLPLAPQPAALERVATLQQLCRRKFGVGSAARRAACKALGITAQDLKRLHRGIDLTDGLLRQIEELPDYQPEDVDALALKKQRPITNPIYEYFEKEYAHIPKPAKFGPRSKMSIAELRSIGNAWFGDEWIESFAALLGYDLYHFTQLINGDRRYLRLSAERYIRKIQAEHIRKGGSLSLRGPIAHAAPS